MTMTRRTLIASTAVLAAAPALARAADADPRMADRSLGSPDAKVVMQEWFSLTCTHCAAWSQEVFPDVKAKLIDTGKLRYIYRDFPLDQVALTAAMVARALPPIRYEAFVNMLLGSQDRWAFARGVDTNEELFRRAALAGMPRAVFDATINDAGLKTAILTEQQGGVDKYNVNSTPTFVVNEKAYAGEQPYAAIARYVAAAAA